MVFSSLPPPRNRGFHHGQGPSLAKGAAAAHGGDTAPTAATVTGSFETRVGIWALAARDGRDAAAHPVRGGLYFVRVRAGREVGVVRLILLR